MTDSQVQITPEAHRSEVIFDVWNRVIGLVNHILEGDRQFGFDKINVSIDPSIDHVINGLTILESILEIFVDSDLLDHDEQRQALNAKQCVFWVRLLGKALKAGNMEDYNLAIERLDSQPKF